MRTAVVVVVVLGCIAFCLVMELTYDKAAYYRQLNDDYTKKADNPNRWCGRWIWTWSYDNWMQGVFLCWVISCLTMFWALAEWWEGVQRLRKLFL
jgi:hypothetical protein